jgi:hypothetical protein
MLARSGRLGRSIASAVLVAAGAILLFFGVLALWAYDTLFTADRFAGSVVEAVERESVRTEIGRLIADQAISQRSDLIAVRPLLETVVDTVLGSIQFQRILTVATRDLHHVLFATDHHSILLDLSDVMTLVVGGLRAFDPDLAARVPSNLEAGLIAFSEQNYATDLVRVAEDVKHLAFLLPALALIAFAGSVALSPNRRRALTSIGIVLGAGAVIVLVGLDLARHMVGGQFDSPDRARAVEAVFEVFTTSLVSWLWVIAMIGVALAAAASTSVSVTDTRTRLAGLRRLATTTPTSTWGRLAYAAGAVLVGILIVLVPHLALVAAARAAGLLAIYLGGSELLRLTGLASAMEAGPGRPGDRRTSPVRFSPHPLAGAFLSVALMVGGLVVWLNRDAFRSDSIVQAAEIERCNGHEQLCARTLPDIAFAATHNSMSAAREPGWYFASHDGGILAQLQAGVRGFLIDTHYGYAGSSGVSTDLSNPAQRAQIESTLDPAMIDAANRLSDRRSGVRAGTKREVFLCHGFCELGATPLDRALRQIHDFLKANPHEVVILFFEDYVTPQDTEDSFTRSRLIDYVYTYTPGSPWPTLREMIERDERVLVLSENVGDKPKPAWYHDGFALAQETPFSFKTPEDFNCLPNRGHAENPLFQINHWVEKLPPVPNDAVIVNAYDLLLARARQCQQLRSRVPNIVAINFYEIGDLLRVVDALNGVESSPDRSVR